MNILSALKILCFRSTSTPFDLTWIFGFWFFSWVLFVYKSEMFDVKKLIFDCFFFSMYDWTEFLRCSACPAKMYSLLTCFCEVEKQSQSVMVLLHRKCSQRIKFFCAGCIKTKTKQHPTSNPKQTKKNQTYQKITPKPQQTRTNSFTPRPPVFLLNVWPVGRQYRSEVRWKKMTPENMKDAKNARGKFSY